jgi:hypothetical protein
MGLLDSLTSNTADPQGTTPSWMTQLFGDGSNGGLFGGGGATNAFTLAGLGSAAQMFNNSNQYKDTAQTAANMANPFGDRSYYADQLKKSYQDPTAFLNDPGHQVLLQRGLNDVSAQNAAKGYLGSGNMLVDLSKYASDSNATYLDNERKTMANLAGAQFDPSNAANMLMKGNDQSITAQNSALSALMAPFMAQMGQNKINNTNGGGNGGIPSQGGNLKAPNGIPQDVWNQILGKLGLGGNFTTMPGAPGGGGINGTGDGPAGPGGDAPGSSGDQYPWPDLPSDPTGPFQPGDMNGPDNWDFQGGGGNDTGGGWDAFLQSLNGP